VPAANQQVAETGTQPVTAADEAKSEAPPDRRRHRKTASGGREILKLSELQNAGALTDNEVQAAEGTVASLLSRLEQLSRSPGSSASYGAHLPRYESAADLGDTQIGYVSWKIPAVDSAARQGRREHRDLCGERRSALSGSAERQR
jgi:hypothetical protein